MLEYLCDHPQATQAAMGRALHIDKSNMSALVATIRARNFVDGTGLTPNASARNYVEAVRRGRSGGREEIDA